MQLPSYTITYSESALQGNRIVYLGQLSEVHKQHMQQLETLIADNRKRTEYLLQLREDDDRYRQKHPVLHFLERLADALFVAPHADRSGKVARSRADEDIYSETDWIMSQAFIEGSRFLADVDSNCASFAYDASLLHDELREEGNRLHEAYEASYAGKIE